MGEPLRVVFFGSDALAQPVLDFLAGEGRRLAEIVGVYTQPDRPHGRGQRLLPGPIKAWAEARGVPVFQPERLSPADAARVRDELRADASLVMAYGLLLKDDLLVAPRLGTFNVHTSLLPRFRGASPVATAVATGERETGVTFMRLVRRLDAGPVAEAERVAVEPLDTGGTVTAKLSLAAVPLVARCLAGLAAGTLAFREQDETQATYCRRLERADGVLDFHAPAAVLAARINGLNPWPGCAVPWAGEPLKIGLADAPGDEAGGAAPGTVLGADAAGLRVATGQGVLRLLRLQRPAGRMLAAPDFLRGSPVRPGTVLPSQPMPALLVAPPMPRG